VLAKNSSMSFAICVDDHGYVPSHNLRYTRPLTGDPETDKVNNRTKRLFDDRTGAGPPATGSRSSSRPTCVIRGNHE